MNVSAEAQTLNTTDASLGNSVGNTPYSRRSPAKPATCPTCFLFSLACSICRAAPDRWEHRSEQGGDSRSGAVNGVRSDQGNVTLDGIDDNDQVYGFAFTGVLRETQDSVEEFRVTTANSNSDQGRSAGAEASMVTKSGTNQFHGAAYEYHRPTIHRGQRLVQQAGATGQRRAEHPRQAYPQYLRADWADPS